MAIDCFLDRNNSIVFTTFWGEVSRAQLVRHAKRLVANAEFEPAFSQIIDLRELVRTDIGFHDLSLFAKECDPFSETSRRAVLTSADFAFGLARMYQGLKGDPDNFMYFKEMSAARRWVGLDR
jgi:hypothetical protein